MVKRISNALSTSDWTDARRKVWHLALTLAAAYAAFNPEYAWAVPALTAAAGMSDPPSKQR